MKAVAVFPANNNIQVIDVPDPPAVSGHQVLVRTLAVGLCGTDREIIEQGYGSAPDGFDYLILGHECLAEVLEIGPEVTKFQPGQLVVPTVRRPCNNSECGACKIGRSDFCLTGQFTERGIKALHGFLCEKFIDEEQYFHPVPDALKGVGVLVEPLTIAEKALIQVRDVQDRLPYINTAELKRGDLEGTTSVVLGAGPVALLGAMALLNAGSRVFVYSRSTEPNASSKLIESVGAEYVSSQTLPPEQLLEIAGRVDIIYEATGASSFSLEMTSILGRNGICIFTGVPGRREPVRIDTDRIMRDMVLKNQLIVGTVNAGPMAFQSAIRTLGELHRRWPANVESLITSRISPDQVEEFLSSRSKGIKTVVEFA